MDRRIFSTGVAVGAVLLLACNQDRPTGQALLPSGPLPLLASSSTNCNANTHPGGTIVDQVTTPPAWAIAVRDDGLAYFTEAFNAGVGITSTRTKTVDGFIPTGNIPTGVAFSPDGATAYVANQGDNAANIPLAGGGFGVGVTPDDNQAWVTIPSQGKVQVFNLQNRHLSLGLNVGGEPRRLGFSQHGGIGAIANLSGYITFVR